MFERLRAGLFSALVLSAPIAALSSEPIVLPLWPNLPRDATAGEESFTERGKNGKQDRSFKNVRNPTLSIYLPEKPSGAALIICPGGGYGSLAIDKEGHDVARWLNSLGVAGLVLKYRLPRPDLSKNETPWPLQDAQRALRLTRANSAEWKLDPLRIGILGFSAGGHLASTAATHFDAGQPGAADAIERLSSRPDFAILIYPVISMKDPNTHPGSRGALLGKSPDASQLEEYSGELRVSPRTPPCFLVHAKDDGVKAGNSIEFDAALKKAGIASELHLFEKGGHGYGLGIHGGEVAEWPERCAAWLEKRKILGK